jgi:hypothetical protein
MIISHKLKFIFITNTHIGDIQIVNFFKQYIGPDDIINTNHIYTSSLKDAAIEDKCLTIDQWYSYEKYMLVRNPWDLMKSYFDHYRTHTKSKSTFEEWVLRQNRCYLWEQIAIRFQSKNYDVPKFGKSFEIKFLGYEEMPYSIWMICIALKLKISIDDVKKQFVSSEKTFDDIEHTPKTINHIRTLCKNIIQIAGYNY